MATLDSLELFTPHDVERKNLDLSDITSLHHLSSWEVEPGAVKKKKRKQSSLRDPLKV